MAKSSFQTSPWESIEGITKRAARPVKKAAADVVGDIRQAVMGDLAGETVEKGTSPQSRPSQVLAQGMAAADAKNLQLARQNLARINAEIDKAREERLRKHREKQHQEQQAQVKREEKKVEQRQKKETVLDKLIKSRQGTKESIQRVSG